MIRALALLSLLLGAGVAAAAEPEVKIGDKIDDLHFKDIRYLSRSLSDFGDKKAFVLVFVDSNCPIAEKYLPVLQRLASAYRDKGVQFVAVNSGPNDTIVTMAAQAVEYQRRVSIRQGRRMQSRRCPRRRAHAGSRRPRRQAHAALSRTHRRSISSRRPPFRADAPRFAGSAGRRACRYGCRRADHDR